MSSRASEYELAPAWAPSPVSWVGPTSLRDREGRIRASGAEKDHPWRDTGRRVLNVAVAGLALLGVLPVMVLVAIAVRLSSPGPIIFSQDRVGVDRRRASIDRRTRRRGIPDRRAANRGGKMFRIFKFRTMYVDGDSERQVWARKNDPRITPVGRFLRHYRLDELPQLVNVLLGHMNIVGPRPEQPGIFHELRKEFDRYPNRQQVLPGITGWAQVNHGYDQSIKDVQRKLELDLEYLDRRSTVEDFKIMARTVPVMVFKQGSV